MFKSLKLGLAISFRLVSLEKTDYMKDICSLSKRGLMIILKF